MHEYLDKFLHYGYLVVFFYSLGGGMIALAALGVFSASSQVAINPAIAISLAAAANFLGAQALFYFTRTARSEFAPQLRAHRRKIALLLIFHRKNAALITLVCKFLYGFKTIAPMAASLCKLHFARYAAMNLASSCVWAVAVFFAARAASELILRAYEASNPLYFVGGFLLLAGAIYALVSKISAKKRPQKGENA